MPRTMDATNDYQKIVINLLQIQLASLTTCTALLNYSVEIAARHNEQVFKNIIALVRGDMDLEQAAESVIEEQQKYLGEVTYLSRRTLLRFYSEMARVQHNPEPKSASKNNRTL